MNIKYISKAFNANLEKKHWKSLKVHSINSGKHLKFIKLFDQNNRTIIYKPIVFVLQEGREGTKSI